MRPRLPHTILAPVGIPGAAGLGAARRSCQANPPPCLAALCAVGAMSTNPKNTISQLKRLLGKKFSDPHVQQDLAYFPFKVVEGPNGECLYEVGAAGAAAAAAAAAATFACERSTLCLCSQLVGGGGGCRVGCRCERGEHRAAPGLASACATPASGCVRSSIRPWCLRQRSARTCLMLHLLSCTRA